MKIAAISTSRLPSSTANSIQLMKACHALAQLGESVRLFVPENPGTETERGWERLAEIYGLSQPFEISWLKSSPALKRYDFAWEAARQARRWGAEMAVTWTPQAAVLTLRDQTPTLLEVHDVPTGRVGPWLYQRFMRMPGRKRLLVITEALRRKLGARFGPELAQIEVEIAPNGVDLAQYENMPDPVSARRQLNLTEKPTVAYSGHFYAGRGMDLLLGLARQFRNVQFLWIGGRAEDKAAWQARLAKEGLEHVILTGFVEQRRLPLYQAAADILLMPYENAIAGSSGGNSAEICSPMKMFDYLAAGRAILSSDLTVIHEVLNEANAVFAPPEDLEAWSAVLNRLIEDEPLRLCLSQQARQDAEKYTWLERARKAMDGI